jgi:FtsH-binding integral membrane protein
MKVFLFLTEVIGWLQIVASPFITGLIIGAIVYVNKPDTTGLITGLVIAATGLVIGIIWATRVWRKHGTIGFLSRVMGTPDLDDEEDHKRSV